MSIPEKIFKAYDIRGIYPDELNDKAAYKIGLAFGDFIKPKNAAVGRDMRISSPSLFENISRGLTDQGIDVVDLGICSSDQFYYSVGQNGYDAGMMITASHNPKEYNGIKMVRANDIPISDATGILQIRDLVLGGISPDGSKKGKITHVDTSQGFIDKLETFIDPTKIKPMKIVMDAANGTAGPIAPRLFSTLPIEYIPMYFELDGSFPNHQANPLIEENRRELQARVLSEKADLGFAWDGDADRFFVIDDLGRFVSGDFLTALLAKEMLATHPGATILYDLRASNAVPDTVAAAGGKSIMCRVGHAFFKQRMRDENAIFAGEVTGHYYFKDFYCCDTGMVPALKLIQLLSREGKKLSELLQPLEEKYFISGEINSKVSDVNGKLAELEAKYKGAKMLHLDGLSVNFPDWWFNVRPSNTEPLLRLNLEAKTKEMMEEKRDEVLSIIRS